MNAFTVVQCTHCGHKGVIAVAGDGPTLIAGNCPACGEILLIPTLTSIPLDRAELENGDKEQIVAHMRERFQRLADLWGEQMAESLADQFIENGIASPFHPDRVKAFLNKL